MLHSMLPGDGDVTGMLALMLLTHARRRARVTADCDLVCLTDQDRSQWDRPMIEEGVGLLTGALKATPVGPYQLQAAIAA